MMRLITAVLAFVMVLSGISFAVTPAIVAADSPQTTISYPDTTVSGEQTGNFPEVWDLTSGDLVLTFTADLNGMVDTSGAHAWSEFGIRAVGYGNFNPTWQVEGAGVWLATDYDWTPGTFAPDPPGKPSLDMDDKLILQRGGGCGEGGYGIAGTGYNLPGIPPAPGNNHRIWWDRDGVDPWQNPTTANTGGLYNVVITLHATGDTSGTAYMTINGLDQGFETDGNWNTIELTPAGMTFAGNMKQMQVFYGIYGYGATHSATFKDISVSGYPCVITVIADDQSKVYGELDPELTYTCDTPGVTFTGALSRDSGENIGSYVINQGDLSAPGYIISYTAGTLTVNKASASVVLTSSDNPSLHLQRVTFTAAVAATAPGAGTPTGTVTFKDGTTTLGTMKLVSGKATYITPCLRPLCLGSHSITAVYNGDSNFEASTSPVLTQTVLTWLQWLLRSLGH